MALFVVPLNSFWCLINQKSVLPSSGFSGQCAYVSISPYQLSKVCRLKNHEINPLEEMAFVCFVTTIAHTINTRIHSFSHKIQYMNSKLVFYFCTEVNSTLNDEIKAPPSVRKLFNKIAINYMVTRTSGPKQQTEKKQPIHN